jgi:hypothetical protein
MGGQKETLTLEEYHHRYGVDPEPEPEPPDSVTHIDRWFWELSERRQQGMNGPLPLSFSEIEAWSRVTATPVRPIEARMMVDMDNAYLSACAEVRGIAERERREGQSQ